MARTVTFDCVVTCAGGTYTTSTVQGFRASCTHSAKEAVKRLAEKVFGRPAYDVQTVGDAFGPGLQRQVWRAR